MRRGACRFTAAGRLQSEILWCGPGCAMCRSAAQSSPVFGYAACWSRASVGSLAACCELVLPCCWRRFGGFGSPAEYDAAAATWPRPRLEVEHVKVWAWPPRP